MVLSSYQKKKELVSYPHPPEPHHPTTQPPTHPLTGHHRTRVAYYIKHYTCSRSRDVPLVYVQYVIVSTKYRKYARLRHVKTEWSSGLDVCTGVSGDKYADHELSSRTSYERGQKGCWSLSLSLSIPRLVHRYSYWCTVSSYLGYMTHYIHTRTCIYAWMYVGTLGYERGLDSGGIND